MIEIAEGLLDVHPFFDVHYVSGEKVDGLEALEDIVQTLSRATPWEYAPDAKTDRSPEMVALEVTREKLYQRVNKELPYRCAVKHVDWKFLRDGSVRVEQEILVRPSTDAHTHTHTHTNSNTDTHTHTHTHKFSFTHSHAHTQY
jgi:GTP-binding protein Era